MLLDPAADAPRGAEQVFEELYDPAFLIDPEEGRFIGANVAASAFLGYDPEELRQLTPADIHPHEIPRLDAFLDAVSRNRRWSTDELACRSKDGGLIPAQVRASLVTLDGRSYILAIVRDRREEQLAELGRSIRKLTHDLRNTMVASRMMGDRLRQHEDPMVQRSAELISRSVNRAVRMCEAALSAGTSEERAPQRERFPLGDAVDEVVAAIGPEQSAQVTLAAHDIEGIDLDADFDQVFRILMNMVRNALAAGAERIEIAAERGTQGVTIEIADDGPGLPDSVQRQLFSEKSARGTRTGAGLGLAIAWELASNHGGRIDLHRTGADGTAFRVSIPDPPPSGED
jgi:hypothetical protein